MAKKPQNTINLGIRGIEITNQSINLPKDPAPIAEGLGVDMSIEYRLAPADKVLLANIFIALKDPKNFESAPIATLGVTFAYIIENFSEVFKSANPKHTEVPETLTEIINSISISTCRGILFSQFRGTFLHQVVLPIMDPKKIQRKP